MGRKERIETLRQICLKNNLTPDEIGFADKIFQICAALWGVDRRTARTYLVTLIDLWRFDQWKITYQVTV